MSFGDQDMPIRCNTVKASLRLEWLACLVLLTACRIDAELYPGPEPEQCDGVDNDRDGQVDEDFDQDGDGYAAGSTCEDLAAMDCDDNNPSIHPGAQEICDNTVDEDCDGQSNQSRAWYEDVDADGYGASDHIEWACTPP